MPKKSYKSRGHTWTEASDYTYSDQPMSTIETRKSGQSYLGWLLFIVAACILYFIWDGRRQEQLDREADSRATISQYRDTDPRRALAEHCRMAKTAEERLMACR